MSPDRHSPPHVGWIARLARIAFAMVSKRVTAGRLTLQTPDGATYVFDAPNPGPEAEITWTRWRALRRLVLGGEVGFAESYIDGDWSTPDLTAVMAWGAENIEAVKRLSRAPTPFRLAHDLYHRFNANSRAGSRRNIPAHYDLGNGFYRTWLDEGMSYSSAIFGGGADTLEAAQTAKQDRILSLLDLKGGETVLEIGCGWGGLAERMALAGCHVTGLTLSPAQLSFAESVLQEKGLATRADLRLQDYREVGGKYDRIVSIEMLEAVGEKFWPTYFGKIKQTLAPGGVGVLQVITIADERFEDYRKNVEFIQRYIFPGGMLPAPSLMRRQIEAAGLRLKSVETFGASYARTLAEWRARFLQRWPHIEAQGFPPSFRRLWEYYLCYCEAGFRIQATDVGLYCLTHA